MLALRSESLIARVDPDHGGEIVDLVDLATGRQLLGRPPFSSTAAGGRVDVDEATWTAGYRGGWQTLLPNAGNACSVAGDQHGFHGAASAAPWRVDLCSRTVAKLSWAGHGLAVSKSISVEAALRIEYEIEALDDSVPLVAVEHLAVGLELLDPSVEIDLPSAPCYELDEQAGPVRPPGKCALWPSVSLLDGGEERADVWSLARPRSRLQVLYKPAEGWCAIRNPTRGQGLAVAWDLEWFRHCWIWHENRVSQGPWRGMTEMLVLEPSTVPHTLGLSRALADGDADVLVAGDRVATWIVARPFSADRTAVSVDAAGHAMPAPSSSTIRSS